MSEQLRRELDALVAIDTARDACAAELSRLQLQRERQVGRMEAVAELAEINLAEYVGSALTGQPMERTPDVDCEGDLILPATD